MRVQLFVFFLYERLLQNGNETSGYYQAARGAPFPNLDSFVMGVIFGVLLSRFYLNAIVLETCK